MRKIIEVIENIDKYVDKDDIVETLQPIADEVATMDAEIDRLTAENADKDALISKIQTTNYELLKKINGVETVKETKETKETKDDDAEKIDIDKSIEEMF